MMLIKPAVLFLAFIVAVRTLQNPLISAPFDNFRIECAKSSGAVRISVRMVGSQGFIRQDIVFVIVCERVDELYPWRDVPTGIVELEREDCYYSHLFDPIVDTESLYTCRPREYISGITRLSDTRIQVLCCRLRTRDEANCREKEFTKPIGFDPRTEIYYRKQLINSIAVEGHNYRVRFCDLTPRAIGLIYGDLPVTTTITTETPNQEYASETERDILNTTTRRKAYTTNGRPTSQAATSSTTNQIIQIFRPSSLYNFEEKQNTRNMSTLSPTKNHHSQDIESSLKVQRTSGGKFSTVTDTVAKERGRSTNWMTNEIRKQNFAVPIASFIPTSITQNHSIASKEKIVSSDRTRPITTLSYFATSSLHTTTSASLILLKPLSSKTHTEVTSRSRPTTKTSTRRRMKQTLSPTISTAPFMTTPQSTTISARIIELEHTTKSSSLSSDQPHNGSSSGVHIDEETKYSPFENKNNNPSHDNEAFESDSSLLLTSTNPFDMTTSVENGDFSYKISNEIRRTPIKSPRKQVEVAYSEFKDFTNKQTNKVDHEFNFPSFGDENTEDNGLDYAEYDLPMKKSADGSRTYVPENQEPLIAPLAVVYDVDKQNNVSGNAKRKKKKVQKHSEGSDQEQKDGEEQFENVSRELLPMNDDEVNLIPMDVYTPSSVKPSSTVPSEQDDLKFPTTSFSQTDLEKTEEDVYDPAKFYRTPPPKRPTQTEKVLTFCTKDIAIRDRYNLVIACGSETEIWQPFRCPKGSECFFSSDSTYRICCAVAEPVRYAQ